MALNLVARTFRFAGVMIDKVRINEIRLKSRDGKLMWVKRRRPGSRVLALGANCFSVWLGTRFPWRKTLGRMAIQISAT